MSKPKAPLSQEAKTVIVAQVAEGLIKQLPLEEIAKSLNVSLSMVARLKHSDQMKALMEELAEAPRSRIRAMVSRLSDKAVNVLERALDEGDLDAAKIVFKIAGVDQVVEQKHDTNLTVVLPGRAPEKSIEATYEQKDE